LALGFFSIAFTLGILILVHEIGHFIACKLVGVRVEVFSLGFGPKLLGKKIGETYYQLSIFPLGGYVKPTGEDPEKEVLTGADYELPSKSKIQQIFIFLSGALMNIILAYLIFSFLLLKGPQKPACYERTKIGYIQENSVFEKAGLQIGDEVTSVNQKPVHCWSELIREILINSGKKIRLEILRQNQPQVIFITPDRNQFLEPKIEIGPYIPAEIGRVLPQTPASEKELLPGDKIVKINDQKIQQWYEIIEIIQKSPGQELTFLIQRKEQLLEKKITPCPKLVADKEIGFLGIQQKMKKEKYNLASALVKGGVMVLGYIRDTYLGLWKLVTREISLKAACGPLGIGKLAVEQAKSGFLHLLSLIALISVNLAVINLLPIPVLDGGLIMFACLAGIRRKELSPKSRNLIQQIGLGIIITLGIIVTWNDLLRLLAR
jgi:regulator of sigma E protease